jgi:predicted nucleic-acid-binding protein
MIALDTNFLVRLIAGDDRAQERAVLRLLAAPSEKFFIGDVTLAELVWVLEEVYVFKCDELVCALDALLNRADVVFEDPLRVRRASRHLAAGGDFADALIVGRAQAEACSALASFDKDLKKRFPDFIVVPS